MADPRIQLITQLTQAISPPVIATGIVGNLLNIVVLRTPGLYNHPCSRYFLALASNNLFFSIFPLMLNLLSNAYHLDPTANSRLWCKLVVYIQQVSGFMSPYFIVLASI